MKKTLETVVLLNFGCSDIQKFARAIRDRHIYTMVMPYTVSTDRIMQETPSAIIVCSDAGSCDRQESFDKFSAIKLPIFSRKGKELWE